MANLKFGRGLVTLTMSDTFDRIYRRAIDKLAPGLLPSVQRAVDDVFGEAKASWPVKSGVSRRELRRAVGIDSGGTKVRGSVTNGAPYARMITVKGTKRKKVFVELLRKPMRKRGRALARELAKETVKVLSGR